MQEWSKNLGTVELLNKLRTAKVEAQDNWANRNYATELENAFALGGIATIDSIVEYIEELK